MQKKLTLKAPSQVRNVSRTCLPQICFDDALSKSGFNCTVNTTLQARAYLSLMTINSIQPGRVNVIKIPLPDGTVVLFG